jgi:hypothetical protein
MGEVKEHRIGRLRRIGVAAALSCPPGEAREVWRQLRAPGRGTHGRPFGPV